MARHDTRLTRTFALSAFTVPVCHIHRARVCRHLDLGLCSSVSSPPDVCVFVRCLRRCGNRWDMDYGTVSEIAGDACRCARVVPEHPHSCPHGSISVRALWLIGCANIQELIHRPQFIARHRILIQIGSHHICARQQPLQSREISTWSSKCRIYAEGPSPIPSF